MSIDQESNTIHDTLKKKERLFKGQVYPQKAQDKHHLCQILPKKLKVQNESKGITIQGPIQFSSSKEESYSTFTNTQEFMDFKSKYQNLDFSHPLPSEVLIKSTYF